MSKKNEQLNLTACVKLVLISLILISFNSCDNKLKETQENELAQHQNSELFKSVISKHLDAVSNKDLMSLKSTLSPNGNMELIQQNSEIVYTVDEFMKFHQEWFNVPGWTFKTKLLSTNIGDKIGVATTEILYEEPERNGKPYFNRMIVSYTLEKINGNWYVIKDHASSIEKTK